jgi:predicted phage terminase large subunit-like protein
MVVATTRWGERDLVPLFEDMGFKIITMPALGYWDRTEGPNGEEEWGVDPLWPEMETREELEEQREEDEIIFELVKQGNPKVVGGDVFNIEMINRVENIDVSDPDFIATFTEIVQSIDTAGGKDRKKGDFFVDATIGIRPGQDGREEMWILDIERGRYPAPTQEKMVKIKGEQFNPQLILIEERNEGGALYQRLIESTRLPVKAWYPEKDKEFRAITFANAMNAGKVFVPKGAKWVRPFEMEAAAFPRGAHDDQIDAISAGYNHTGGAGPRLRVLESPRAAAGLSKSQRRFK